MKIDLKTIKDPFTVEKIRQHLAERENYSNLKKMYSAKLPAVKNINTAKFWDSKINLEKAIHKKSPIVKDRINVVFQFIKSTKIRKGRLLDIGVGYGLIEKKLSKYKKEISLTGIDISKKAITAAKSKFKGNFKIGSANNLEFPDEKFDTVIALEILEHIPPKDTFKVFSEVKKVLRQDGYFIISVPMNEGLEELVKSGKNLNAHLRIYTKDLLKAELHLSGFKIIKDKELFAFSNKYRLKTILSRTVLPKRWRPNIVIILAQKP